MLTSPHSFLDGDVDIEEALGALERSIEGLAAALGGPNAPVGVTQRLRRLHDELASHALAANVLVASGASIDSVRPVLRRAAALLDEEGARGLASMEQPFRGSASKRWAARPGPTASA